MIHPRELARSDDPPTSHLAAEQIIESLGDHMHRAYELLCGNPGSTAAELDFINASPDGKVRKRLNDLRKVGLAFTDGTKRCAVSGRTSYRWFPRRRHEQGELF